MLLLLLLLFRNECACGDIFLPCRSGVQRHSQQNSDCPRGGIVESMEKQVQQGV